MGTSRLRGVVQELRKVSLAAATASLTDGELLESFISRCDESAFEALLRRHGPMVLATCRRLLGNADDAEDAFQATFLVLVRKARSIVPRDMVGNWLYGVAYRAALKVKTAAARRRVKESNVPPRQAHPDNTWDDLLPMLDAELRRLPDKYRSAIVLCDLEGKSRSQAARQLGLPVATVSTRVVRGRALLAKRLARHGLALSAGALAMTVAANAASAYLPGTLATRTLGAAALYAGKRVATAAVSAKVLALTEGVLKIMLLKKLKTAATVLVMLTLLGTGAYFVSAPTRASDALERGGGEATPQRDRQPTTPPEGWSSENFEVRAPTRDVARRVAEAAELQRKNQALAWLGKELPCWPERCPIDVRTDEGASKSSTTLISGPNLLKLRMNLHGPLGRILRSDLPHQMTYAILWSFFKQRVPVWAAEGAAIVSSDEMQRTRHEQALPEILSDPGRFLSLHQLFNTEDYPKDRVPFFAESFSVTRFLVERKDRQTFVWFVAQAMRDGWDEAARTYYDFASVKELERAWLRSMAGKSGPSTGSPNAVMKPPPKHSVPANDLVWRILGLKLEIADPQAVKPVNPQLHGGHPGPGIRSFRDRILPRSED